ncbi:helix-turn-helix domain-containing protein [Thiomonas sp.]
MGKKLRGCCRERGWRQADMAERLNCSEAFLSALARGRKIAPRTLLGRLQEILDLTEPEAEEFRRLAAVSGPVLRMDLTAYSGCERAGIERWLQTLPGYLAAWKRSADHGG